MFDLVGFYFRSCSLFRKVRMPFLDLGRMQEARESARNLKNCFYRVVGACLDFERAARRLGAPLT